MNPMSWVKEGVAHAAGNIEKAVIEIVDEREKELTVEQPVSMGGSSFGGSSLGGSSLGSGSLSLPALSLGATKRYFTVQFNPSDLSFSGYGGGQMAKTDYSSTEGKKITFAPVAVRIMMNVRLIFDQVDPQDAFMSDKVNTSMTSMAQGAVKGVRIAAGKKKTSVQAEVEGFVAALRSSHTRKISFYWGAMQYCGVLSKVSAQYTMFNVQGEPIRAMVRLALVCADEDVAPGEMGIWQESYENAFQGGNQSYVKTAQKAGNLLNINL